MNPRAFSTLPPEILSSIASFTSHNALSNIVRTSSLLYSFFCPALYNTIDASRDESQQILETLSRLDRKGLENKIPYPSSFLRRLKTVVVPHISFIETQEEVEENDLVMRINIEQTLKNTVTFSPTSTESQLQSFELYSNVSLHAILEVIYSPSRFPQLSTIGLQLLSRVSSYLALLSKDPVVPFSISWLRYQNLQAIELISFDVSSNDASEAFCVYLEILRTHSPNLQSLKIGFYIHPNVSTVNLQAALNNLHFATLNTLTLLVLPQSTHLTSILPILCTHSNIKSLHIYRIASLELNDSHLATLQEFEGSIRDCATICDGKRPIHHLRLWNLDSVKILRANDADTADLESDFLTALSKTPTLQRLHLMVGSWSDQVEEDFEYNMTFVDIEPEKFLALAQSCRNLTHLELSTGSIKHLIADALSCFAGLAWLKLNILATPEDALNFETMSNDSEPYGSDLGEEESSLDESESAGLIALRNQHMWYGERRIQIVQDNSEYLTDVELYLVPYLPYLGQVILTIPSKARFITIHISRTPSLSKVELLSATYAGETLVFRMNM